MDEKLFNDVKSRLNKNKRKPYTEKSVEFYLLTGKLYCGYCHYIAIAENGTSAGNGIVYRYYKCAKKKAHSLPCECKPISKKILEDLIINATIEYALADEQIAYIVGLTDKNKQLERNQKLERFEKHLKETQNSINSIVDMVCKGMGSKSYRKTT